MGEDKGCTSRDVRKFTHRREINRERCFHRKQTRNHRTKCPSIGGRRHRSSTSGADSEGTIRPFAFRRVPTNKDSLTTSKGL